MKHALVVINKMDQHVRSSPAVPLAQIPLTHSCMQDWNTARYDETKIRVAEILTKRGVKSGNPRMLFVSASRVNAIFNQLRQITWSSCL